MKTAILGGRLIDPANGIDSQQNVLIENGKVVYVGTQEPEADQVICAEGKVVCPGFIDSHMHEDPVKEDGTLDIDEETAVFSCMLRMGVTTVVGGNCGSTACGAADYLDKVDQEGAPVNVAMLVGSGYCRVQAGATDKYAKATPEQIRNMADQIRKDLKRGCAGLSYGIRYYPGMDADELYATAEAVVGTGKPITAHIRDDAAAVFTALHEFVDTAKMLKIQAQVSHIGSMAGFGQMEEFLRQIDEYRMTGVDVMCDCYPYSAFSTGLGSTTYDEGWLERYHCDYDVLELCEGKYKGQRCTKEIFDEQRASFPDCVTVCYVMKPEEIERALTHPSVLLVSDATMDHGQGHPRAAGTFPRLIAEYVRSGKMSLYEAIRKMTTLPAQRYHLEGKGRLNPGADADLVIFDPDTIQDQATFQEPILPPLGIDKVIVGGRIAAENGKICEMRLGKSVRVY